MSCILSSSFTNQKFSPTLSHHLFIPSSPSPKLKPKNNPQQLQVWVELLDGILMPVAVGFLYLLAISPVLPEVVRAARVHSGAGVWTFFQAGYGGLM